MRYTHGCKPRNPYNMIIQENHAAGRAIFIITYGDKSCLLYADNPVKEAKNCIHTIHHDAREELTKEQN